jgi:hypothetical protein
MLAFDLNAMRRLLFRDNFVFAEDPFGVVPKVPYTITNVR